MQKAREDLQNRIKSIRNLVSGASVIEDGAQSETLATPGRASGSPVHNSLSPEVAEDLSHTSTYSATPATPANWSHVDDRPISLPSEYSKVKGFVQARHTPRGKPFADITPQTPLTGLDR